MLKKVLLITPNYKYFPGALETKLNYRQSSLGLAYIAAAIRSRCRVEVKVYDAMVLNAVEEEVVNYINSYKPQIIGISVHTLTVEYARNVALAARRIVPEAFIVFGGPHVSALPFENLDVADVCVIGEGDDTVVELVNQFLSGGSFDGVEGIALRKNGSCIKTKTRTLIADLDSLPLPARDLFPFYKQRHIYPYRLATPYCNTIVTSRGCSFNCTFCSNEIMWQRRVRNRSISNALVEIEVLVKQYNTSLLFIHDDNFTENHKRVIEFCEEKQKYFPQLKWICHSRSDCLTRDLLEKMKASGCVEIQVGVESGSDAILAKCNKGSHTAAMRKTFHLLEEAKINSWATFIIGNEGDTKESIEQTIEFAKEIDPTYCSFLFLTPLPGTQIYERFVQKGYINTFQWSRYNFHSAPVFETEHLSLNLLLNLRKKAYRVFYLRPTAVVRFFVAAIASRQWGILLSDACILMKFLLGLIAKDSHYIDRRSKK